MKVIPPMRLRATNTSGMRSLAEGVETAEQLAMATELGCTFAQGYHIARPMPAADLTTWLRARRLTRDRPGRSAAQPAAVRQ